MYGTLVSCYLQGKTEVLGEKLVPVSLCPPQISYGLSWDRNRVCAIRGRHSYGRCHKHSVQFTHLIGLYFHSLQK